MLNSFIRIVFLLKKFLILHYNDTIVDRLPKFG